MGPTAELDLGLHGRRGGWVFVNISLNKHAKKPVRSVLVNKRWGQLQRWTRAPPRVPWRVGVSDTPRHLAGGGVVICRSRAPRLPFPSLPSASSLSVIFLLSTTGTRIERVFVSARHPCACALQASTQVSKRPGVACCSRGPAGRQRHRPSAGDQRDPGLRRGGALRLRLQHRQQRDLCLRRRRGDARGGGGLRAQHDGESCMTKG